MDFRTTSVEGWVQRVRLKELSARELVESALQNIENTHDALNAFCSVAPEKALREAEAIDKRLARGDAVGPLAGIPVGIKDLEDAQGFVTTHGSALHVDDAPADIDSPLVARLKAAGCIVVGKTNTPEFGYKGVTDNPPFGATRNPWNLDYTTGGSSGGSTAVIAGGVVPLCTGSDGGGSIRIPSALCGLSGIKTSQGRVPVGGPKPPGAGILSVRGPMAHRVRDTVYVLDAVRGDEATDIFGLPRDGAHWRPFLDGDNKPDRVIFSHTMGHAEVDTEIDAVVSDAVAKLNEAGVEVIEREDIWDDDPFEQWWVFWTASRARMHGHLRGTADWERIDERLRLTIEHGLEKITAIDYARAIDACFTLNYRLEEVFQEAPLILTPTVRGHAPRIGSDEGLVNGELTSRWTVGFTQGINMTRNPAGTVNAGFTKLRLPVGLQIIGRQRNDIRVLQAMCFAEDLLGLATTAPHGV
jgi:Asp-tRNA(Asn)/Glu-tRNA(Gln) amidotransferase A subunit family amidase